MGDSLTSVTPEKLRTASRLVGCAEIKTIKLVDGRFRLAADLLSERSKSSPMEVKLSFKAHGRLDGSDLSALAVFQLRGLLQGVESPVVEVACKCDMHYSFPDGFAASDEEVKAFCDTNVLLNAWPYWREFVQNSVSRMNLPPLTLPLFRIVPVISQNDVPQEPSSDLNKRKSGK